MTDKEKLQSLFDAALRAPVDEIKAPTRVFPTVAQAAVPLAVSAPAVAELGVTAAVPEVAETPLAEEGPAAERVNVGLDEQSSKELGILLEEQMQRKSSKRRRELVVTLGMLLAVTGGSFGWFVQSPERVAAAKSAYHDIRSVGDVAGMVASYRKSLDKIAARSHQVDEATESMGVSSSLEGAKDVQMDAEMHSMMIGGGKTTGERNRLLAEKMGKVVKQIAPDAAAVAAQPVSK